jgi:hypothetical protein
MNYGIKYSNEAVKQEQLISYSDSDFAGNYETSKSTTGFVILLNGSPVHWKTQLQRHITLSSTESEVIALCALSKELSWIRRMLIELEIIPIEPAIIRCDNQSTLMIMKSERATPRTRHLRAQNDFVREQVELGELQLEFVRSSDQLADLLTKMVATSKFVANASCLLETI